MTIERSEKQEIKEKKKVGMRNSKKNKWEQTR